MKSWLAKWILVAATLCAAPLLISCGHDKPPPAVPPGDVSCADACESYGKLRRTSDAPDHDIVPCPTSVALCYRVCTKIAYNEPSYAGCIAAAKSCPDIDACQ